MSKTFGQLKANDKVYIIKDDCSVEIVKVTKAVPSQMSEWYVRVTINDYDFTIPSLRTQFYDVWVGDVYCNIDDAIKTMKERCESALQNYKRASGSLNLLESCYKITKKEHEQMLAQVAQSEILWGNQKERRWGMNWIYRNKRIAQSRYWLYITQNGCIFNVIPTIIIGRYDNSSEVSIVWLFWRFGIEKNNVIPF